MTNTDGNMSVQNSSMRLFMTILGIVVIAETAVMVLLQTIFLPLYNPWIEPILDSFLLTILISPVLWIILVRPLRAALLTEGGQRQLQIELMPIGCILWDLEGKVTSWNSAAEGIFGYTRAEALGRKLHDLLQFCDGQQDLAAIIPLSDNANSVHSVCTGITKTGSTVVCEWNSANLPGNDGRLLGAISMIQDITERRLMEEAQHSSQQLLEGIINTIPVRVFWKDKHFAYLGCNAAFARDAGLADAKDLIGKDDYQMAWHDQAELYRNDDRQVIESGCAKYLIEEPMTTPEGNIITLLTSKIPLRSSNGEISGVVGTYMDITERKLAAVEKAKLTAQLHQAQKMDSVGRLAGGIAHDFNNMLSVMMGHAELALSQMDATQPLHDNLGEIHMAGVRAADLTRQLLAFARRQTIAPRILDLNQTVTNMFKMLQRLIGEDIHLHWHPTESLWSVKIDPSQVDQVLVNLVVNARDAIPGVGKITMETKCCTLGEDYCATHAGSVPGEYVALVVSDDGCGMDKDTLANIFEPFFTTKGAGKGTGLGLSTVYGIVKQNNGVINVYSEMGHGTTFTIYLPRHQGKADQAGTEEVAQPAKRGHETILLVEDEPGILKMTTRMLEMQGYTVVAASTPGEAIRLSKEHSGEIHLLMTDVVMPGMNGRDLAKEILSRHPQIKHLFMSGYTADVIANNGVLDEGVHFIQKPFTLKNMATKIREALDQA